MADIHALDGGVDGKSYRFVLHFMVPDANNSVGVSYREALVASGIGGVTIMSEGTGSGQMLSAELAKIVTGEVLERSLTMPRLASGGTSAAEMLVYVQREYGRQKSAALDELAIRLKYFGFTASEV